MDTTKENTTTSDLSELDAVLASYKEPATVEQPAAPTPGGDGIDAGLFGSGAARPHVGPAKPLPFITHDKSQAPTEQEFYVRGKKKGQPKPPKKGLAPPLNPAGQLSIQATTFISGAVFIIMVDLLIPLFITGVFNWMQSRKKDGITLDYEKLKMTKSQKDDLAQVGDAVVRELKISGSPTALFIMGLAGVYFMNFIMQKSLAEKEQTLKRNKGEYKDEKNTRNITTVESR